MHRGFNRRQALENEAFLAALRRTGNPRLAAASLGVHRSTYTKRRARCAAFATRWDGAIVACDAALELGGGPRPAEGGGHRTMGGEILVGRTRGGRLQLRRAPPGRMTAVGEQAFFRALAASANVRLSAAAAGFTHSAFYQKKKKQPIFAREMRISLEIGYDRLEWALDEAFVAGLGPLPERNYGDTELPPMTIAQAIQQVCFHRNTARLEGELRDRRRPCREPPIEAVRDAVVNRLGALRRAERYEATGSWRFTHEQPPPPLPPLHLVTGWSKASGKPAHNPDLAWFGGWRITDWKKKLKQG